MAKEFECEGDGVVIRGRCEGGMSDATAEV
jgi:hypothetical protein